MNTTTLNMTTLDGGIIIKRGEGGGSTPSSGGESNIEYLDVRNVSDVPLKVLTFAGITYKAYIDGSVEILPIFGALGMEVDDILGVAVDFSTKILNPISADLVSVKEYLINLVGITEEQLNSIPRLTKDEYYSKYGALIQHIDGSLYTKNGWAYSGFSNEEANGVYVTDGQTEVIIAKDTLGEMPWSSKPTTLIDGVSTTTNSEETIRYNTGVEDTAKIAAFDADSAAGRCANYTFPNGQKGYLPSVGELDSIYFFERYIDELMTLIGGAAFKSPFLWTSLQYSAEDAWYFYFGTHDIYHNSKSTNLECRPVCTYIKTTKN